MKLLFISAVNKAEAWREAMLNELPELEFRVWPDEAEPRDDVDYALVWRPPHGLLKTYPNLKAILSLGAGIDGIVCDPELPRHLPIVRLVDHCLTDGMSEYVIYWVLHYHRHMGKYSRMVADGKWSNLPQHDTRLRRVGILGLGELGGNAARKLAALGFDVAGWSRSEKDIQGVTSFTGRDALKLFLARTEILVCLLPLTDKTAGIINAETIAQLPHGAFVINPARGGHVVDAELLAALNSGHLAGATLDVFHNEPPPPDHPFWSHPKVAVTPHMASLTVPHYAAEYIAMNIRRITAGEVPLNVVDLDKGY